MFSKKKLISELKENDAVDDIFVVKFKKGVSQYRKGFSFELTLTDSSGKSIEYKYWGSDDEAKVKALYNTVQADSVIHVQGRVGVYESRIQLTTNEPNTIEVLLREQYLSSEFIRPAHMDPDKMYGELVAAVDGVQNAQLRKLLERVFLNPAITQKLKTHPGAIEIHHNWTGGLLQHTLEVLSICRTAGEIYPGLDKDLLTAGALLHDIGKLEELEVTTRIKATRKGQLMGHLTLSVIQLSQWCTDEGLQPLLAEKLLHIVISHHGTEEHGSPKQPMFPEALAVHYADELSSKLAEMTELIKAADTEDDFMYSKRSGKNVLLR